MIPAPTAEQLERVIVQVTEKTGRPPEWIRLTMLQWVVLRRSVTLQEVRGEGWPVVGSFLGVRIIIHDVMEAA